MIRKIYGLVQKARFHRALSKMLSQQRTQAQEKESAAWYWGNTGQIEAAAIGRCQAILVARDGESFRGFLSRVRRELSALSEFYRGYAGDPDGYGLGTVLEIQRWLEAWD
ncbi:hypothetical protein [Marinobacterium mangrovicola]|nr:hypothetical protein [Marinobacterium mangrovicola]